LAIIGIVVIAIKTGGSSKDGLGVSGELFFGAGLTPFVLSAWSLLTGATKFRKFNYIKCGTSLFLTVLGFILLILSDGNSDVALLFGFNALDIGVLFFISRLFFLGEDDERTIERLEKQLNEARKAVGAGIALAYFYNFLKPVCCDLYRDKDTKKVYGEKDELIMLVKESFKAEPKEHILARRVMTVLIPRDLNEESLRESVRSLGFQGHVKNYSTFRGMYQPVLHKWRSEKNGKFYCSGLCDVPTGLSSIYDRYLDVEQRRKAPGLSQEERDEILPIDIPLEILNFQNNLLQLISQYEETRGRVRIISIPPPPIDRESCWEAIASIDKEVEQ